MAVTMAAVAPARLEARTVNIAYGATSSDVDATGAEDADLDYPMTDMLAEEAQGPLEGSDGDAESGSEVDGDNLDDEEDAEEMVKLPTKRAESDDDVLEEDLSEPDASSGDDDHETDKSSSDAESAVSEKWEGGSEGAEDASVEVANRNNCMLVYPSIFLNRMTLMPGQILRSGRGA